MRFIIANSNLPVFSFLDFLGLCRLFLCVCQHQFKTVFLMDSAGTCIVVYGYNIYIGLFYSS